MASGTSNLFLDKRNKDKDKKAVEERILSQNKKFEEMFDRFQESDNPDYYTLYNTVKQFADHLSLDYKNASSWMDSKELDNFFGVHFMSLSLLFNIVYCCSPNFFNKRVSNYENKIKNDFVICKTRMDKNRDISSQLSEIERNLIELNALVSSVNPNYYPNGDKNVELSKYLEDAKIFLDDANNKFSSLKNGDRVVDSNKDNKLKSSHILPSINEDDVVGLLDNYINRLSKGKDSIVRIYPDKEKFIVAVYKYLNDLKAKYNSDLDEDYLRSSLRKIRLYLYTELGFDIYNNDIKRNVVPKKDNKEDASIEDDTLDDLNDNNSLGSKNANSSSTGANDNKYSALVLTIESYINDFGKKRPMIMNNLNDDYQVKLEKIDGYEGELNDLLVRVKEKNGDIDSLRGEFNDIANRIKNDLGYTYKASVAGRRRGVVNVKKAFLGIGGSLIGIYGISSLVKEIAFFTKFGYLFPSTLPFILPVGMTVAGAVMLKRALSSSSKRIVDVIGNRLKEIEEEKDLDEKRGKGR